MPTLQETIVIERIACYSQFPRGGGIPHHGGTTGENVRLVNGRVREAEKDRERERKKDREREERETLGVLCSLDL